MTFAGGGVRRSESDTLQFKLKNKPQTERLLSIKAERLFIGRKIVKWTYWGEREKPLYCFTRKQLGPKGQPFAVPGHYERADRLFRIGVPLATSIRTISELW